MFNEKQLKNDWAIILKEEFKKPYMRELNAFLDEEVQKGKVIYPSKNEIFEALNLTSFEKTKVVIIGQDPYHGPHQAHGLSFSVREGVKLPPSLKNIFKELQSDLNISVSLNGDLTKWASQGILLLNSVLTVEKQSPASHKNRGWELFTDKIVQVLNTNKCGLVFVLWGAFAQKKGSTIDRHKHIVLESAHPSPFSVHRGFAGSTPFSKINKYLATSQKEIINWQLS